MQSRRGVLVATATIGACALLPVLQCAADPLLENVGRLLNLEKASDTVKQLSSIESWAAFGANELPASVREGRKPVPPGTWTESVLEDDMRSLSERIDNFALPIFSVPALSDPPELSDRFAASTYMAKEMEIAAKASEEFDDFAAYPMQMKALSERIDVVEGLLRQVGRRTFDVSVELAGLWAAAGFMGFYEFAFESFAFEGYADRLDEERSRLNDKITQFERDIERRRGGFANYLRDVSSMLELERIALDEAAGELRNAEAELRQAELQLAENAERKLVLQADIARNEMQISLLSDRNTQMVEEGQKLLSSISALRGRIGNISVVEFASYRCPETQVAYDECEHENYRMQWRNARDAGIRSKLADLQRQHEKLESETREALDALSRSRTLARDLLAEHQESEAESAELNRSIQSADQKVLRLKIDTQFNILLSRNFSNQSSVRRLIEILNGAGR